MPTGYTCDVQSGKITDFQTFALSCAKAFGACITMRDDPHDAPIPDQFQPSDWHEKSLKEARVLRDELESMSDEEADQKAKAEYEELHKDWKESDKRRKAERARYEAMLDRVRAWTPPSGDHVNLKEFMVQQLTESIKFDCGDRSDWRPKLLSGTKWRAEKIDRAIKNIAYHTQQHAEELERVAGRNRWVRQLRESLSVPQPPRGD